MDEKRLSVWRWLEGYLVALTLFAILVPLPEPLGAILVIGAGGFVAIRGCGDLRAFFRREHAEYLADRDKYL